MLKLKLGKRAPRDDARNLKLADYLPDRPPVPPACDWGQFTKRPWPLYRNDVIGDCFFAMGAHLVQTWSAADGAEKVIAEREVVSAYAAATGFDERRPETDQGIDMLSGLKWWRRYGIGGHKIGAFVSVDIASRDQIRAAIFLFGGLAIGLDLPRAAATKPWTFTPAGRGRGEGYARGSWGGHAAGVVAYGERGLLVVTWGGPRWASWDFVDAYADEASAILSNDFLGPDNRAPNGLDVRALRADLARVASPIA